MHHHTRKGNPFDKPHKYSYPSASGQSDDSCPTTQEERYCSRQYHHSRKPHRNYREHYHWRNPSHSSHSCHSRLPDNEINQCHRAPVTYEKLVPQGRPRTGQFPEMNFVACINLANTVVDMISSGNLDGIKKCLGNDVVFSFPDQTGKIPYSGVYLGLSGLDLFFSKYKTYVSHISSYRGETFGNSSARKFIIHLDLTQKNRKTSDSKLSDKPFTIKYAFHFSFDFNDRITRIDVFYETGPLVLFYSKDPESSDDSIEKLS